jgi:hypothetical protein
MKHDEGWQPRYLTPSQRTLSRLDLDETRFIKRPSESLPACCTRLQRFESHRSENKRTERADRFHPRSVTSSLPLYTHALSPMFGALLAGPSVLAFAILLSTSFATQLDELRSPSDMNTLFAPRNTPRTRPLIVTLPKEKNTSSDPDHNTQRRTTHLFIIATTILTRQLGPLVLLATPKDKHGRSHIGAHPHRDLLLHTLLSQLSTPLTWFSTFATNARFATTLASVDTLIDGVPFLNTCATGSSDKENSDSIMTRCVRTRGLPTLHRRSEFYHV